MGALFIKRGGEKISRILLLITHAWPQRISLFIKDSIFQCQCIDSPGLMMVIIKIFNFMMVGSDSVETVP